MALIARLPSQNVLRMAEKAQLDQFHLYLMLSLIWTQVISPAVGHVYLMFERWPLP
jgi:hypothetical protein